MGAPRQDDWLQGGDWGGGGGGGCELIGLPANGGGGVLGACFSPKKGPYTEFTPE